MVLKTGKSSVRPREPLNLLAYAQAFTGEVLSGTTAKWRVSVTSAHYNPPNLDAYKFSIIADSFDVENHEWDTERNYSGRLVEGEKYFGWIGLRILHIYRKAQHLGCYR